MRIHLTLGMLELNNFKKFKKLQETRHSQKMKMKLKKIPTKKNKQGKLTRFFPPHLIMFIGKKDKKCRSFPKKLMVIKDQ